MSTATTPPDGDAAAGYARRRRHPGWRIATPVVLLLCAGLVVVSAEQSEGTDLRPGRYTSLASLVETEAREQEARQAQARQLEAEVRELTEAVREPGVRRRRAEAESLRDPAGLKSEGSAVQLQGIPYPQPYTIEAVGDPADLLGAIDDDADVQAFVADAERPGVDVGWQVSVESRVQAAAFEGLVDFTHARPLRTAGS